MFGVIGSGPADIDLYADLSGVLVNTSIAMMCLSGSAVGLRFFARRLVKQPLLIDDWLILLAVPFAWIVCMLNIECKLRITGLKMTPEAYRKSKLPG